MKRICGVLLFVLHFGTASAGCAWVGEKAGQAHAKIERGTDEMKHGYDKGYKEEHRGGDSQKADAKSE